MVKVIAIDGPSASGKTQIAKKLSESLGAPLLISGKLYRAVALEIINNKISLKNKKKILGCVKNINENYLNSKKLYSSKIDNAISEKSILDFEKSIHIRQNFYPGYYNLGLAYFNTSKLDKSYNFLIKSIHIKKDYKLARDKIIE